MNFFNNKGYALLTVMLISTVAMIFITTILFTLNQHTMASGKAKAYKKELQAAKGVSTYILAALKNGSLTCNNMDPCTPGDTIDLHGGVCTAMGKTNCENISATYLQKAIETSVGGKERFAVAVEINSWRLHGPEQAIVEVVYHLQ